MIQPPAVYSELSWLLGLCILALTSVITSWITQRSTRKDVADIKHQVKNTHASNLRDDLDQLSGLMETLQAIVENNARALKLSTRYTADVARSVEAIEHSMDRRDEITQRRLSELSEDLKTHIREEPKIFSAYGLYPVDDAESDGGKDG